MSSQESIKKIWYETSDWINHNPQKGLQIKVFNCYFEFKLPSTIYIRESAQNSGITLEFHWEIHQHKTRYTLAKRIILFQKLKRPIFIEMNIPTGTSFFDFNKLHPEHELTDLLNDKFQHSPTTFDVETVKEVLLQHYFPN